MREEENEIWRVFMLFPLSKTVWCEIRVNRPYEEITEEIIENLKGFVEIWSKQMAASSKSVCGGKTHGGA